MVIEGEGSGFLSVPSTPDKSRVLDVKPLRSLTPVFPTRSEAPPFVCAPPFGPFPPGFEPFFPFSGPEGFEPAPDLNRQTPKHHTTLAAPLRSFRGPEFNGEAAMDEEDWSSEGHKRSTSRSQKKPKMVLDIESKLTVNDSSFVVGISSSEREDGNRELVHSVLMRFDALRRRLSQFEDAMEASGVFRRANLKASTVLTAKGVRTNTRKRIGAVPGVEIGDMFYFRMELCMLGLHSPSMSGIDYMSVKNGSEEEPLAVSIVSAGRYDDDADDADIIVYTGQGGNAAADQKLLRGNLALERSSRRGNEVRVIRGMKDPYNVAGRVYFYDGLYKIQELWVEKSKSGGNMFKHKLVRLPGQQSAYAVWKSVEKWKKGVSPRDGLILPDLTSGAESLPVSLVNDVDEENGPAYFTYVRSARYSNSFKLTQPSHGCDCHNACQPGNLNCSCIRKNDGNFPYTANGVLVSRQPLVYECGPSCPCVPNCKNRVSQTGLRVRLEVFKTEDRGWGLRSWDPIRAGTFICEYAGEVIEKGKTFICEYAGEVIEKGKEKQDGEDTESDDYAFDTSRVYEPFRWNCEPGLVVEDSPIDNKKDYSIPAPLVISAKNVGNVARFMNHSCYPNIFWQPIVYDNNNESFLHVGFFAMRHIPPMTELTYDYGTSRSGEVDRDSAPQGKRKCLCGSTRCRGHFG